MFVFSECTTHNSVYIVVCLGEFYVVVTGKRTRNAEGLFRGGDFAIDDLSVTAADVIPTTQPPDLGKYQPVYK